MDMKRFLLIFAVALLALAACRKETPAVRDAYDLSTLRFEFTIEYPEASKAVKSGWENEDKVFVFFPDITTDYLTLTYDGSAWGAPVLANSTSPTVSATGTLTAVYLPYGNSATASYTDSKWTFTGGETDTYFLAAEKASYFVTSTSDPATAVATLYMAPRTGYAQFFVPHETASGNVRISCNAVRPAGLASIATDGTVAEVSTGAQGGWMTGYAGTIGDETGYYASGKVVDSPGLNYYFVLEHGSSPSLYYKNFYKQRSNPDPGPIAARGAYKLPAFGSWPDVKNVDGAAFVSAGGGLWATLNLGATDPGALGTDYNTVEDAKTAASAVSKSLATDAEWNALLTNASWLQMTVAGTAGFLVVDTSGATPQYFFLPGGVNYWTKDGHYLQVGTSTATVVESAPPSAYARVLTSGASLFDGSFVDPVDGHDI